MNSVPHEVSIGGVFMPPMLIASLFAAVALVMTAKLLNHYRISKHLFYPPLVLLALMVIYTVLIDVLFFS